MFCLGQWLKFHQHQVNMQECIESCRKCILGQFIWGRRESFFLRKYPSFTKRGYILQISDEDMVYKWHFSSYFLYRKYSSNIYRNYHQTWNKNLSCQVPLHLKGVVSKNVGKKNCDIVLLLPYFYFCFSTYNKTINLFNTSLFTPLLVSNRKVKVENDSSSFVTDDLTQKNEYHWNNPITIFIIWFDHH